MAQLDEQAVACTEPNTAGVYLLYPVEVRVTMTHPFAPVTNTIKRFLSARAIHSSRFDILWKRKQLSGYESENDSKWIELDRLVIGRLLHTNIAEAPIHLLPLLVPLPLASQWCSPL